MDQFVSPATVGMAAPETVTLPPEPVVKTVHALAKVLQEHGGQFQMHTRIWFGEKCAYLERSLKSGAVQFLYSSPDCDLYRRWRIYPDGSVESGIRNPATKKTEWVFCLKLP